MHSLLAFNIHKSAQKVLCKVLGSKLLDQNDNQSIEIISLLMLITITLTWRHDEVMRKLLNFVWYVVLSHGHTQMEKTIIIIEITIITA